MPKAPQRSRALIYVSGTDEEMDEQLDTATRVCARRGYEIAGIVRDHPGEARGFHDAHRMLRDGNADVITFASVTVLPDVLESATGSLPGPVVREIRRRVESQQRTRPIPRPREGGGA